MKRLELGIAVALLAAAVAVPLVIRHRVEKNLRAKNATLRLQADLLGQSTAENKRMSNVVAQVKNSQSLSDEQLTELMKLRNEAGQLHRELGEAAPLQRQMRRIREELQDLANRTDGIDLTALLEDEIDLRRTRVAQFKQWLEERPEEKVPEMQFLSEFDWISAAENNRVMDDEYRQMFSGLRSTGEHTFANMASEAVKRFARANNGQFPTDLSQLKPYFASPIEDVEVILQRYEIVPAKSLTKVLAERIGDWVITQKAPVNRESDARVAIGLTGWNGSFEEGRWDPVK